MSGVGYILFSVIQTSVRADDEAVDLGHLDRGARIAVLRSRMAALGAGEAVSEPQKSVIDPELVLHVPAGMEGVLSAGGLVRQQAVAVSDCPALLVEMVCDVTARGGYAAIVGWPDLLLAQVSESGDLDHVIVIPDPGPDPWSVVGVLVDGLDLVVYRAAREANGGEVAVTPTQARPVLAKLRSGTAALVTVGAHLPGSAAVIDAQVEAFRGIGAGTGRIRGFDIVVQSRAKDGARHGVVTCGAQRPRLEAV